LVNYHHVNHSRAQKAHGADGGGVGLPADQLFRGKAFRDMFAVMLERATERLACA